MATNTDHTDGEQIDWDDLDDAPEQEGSEWINPENGDVVAGKITSFSPRNSENGVIEIDGQPYGLSYSELQKVISALVEGNVMAVKAAEEKTEFTPEDSDETIEYFEKELRFKVVDSE